MTKRIIADCLDTLAHNAANALQPTHYYVGDKYFRLKREATEYVKSKAVEGEDMLDIVSKEFLYPPYDIHKTTSNIFKSWVARLRDSLCFSEWDGAEIIWGLSGSNNFRKIHDPNYKSQRKDKPFHLASIEKWLCKGLDPAPIILDDFELDDTTAYFTELAPEDNLLVHIDKDLNNIPGMHLHSKTFELYEVTREQGIEHFLIQMIMGDRTDNIEGFKGKGKVAAKRVVDSIDLKQSLELIWEDFVSGCFDMYTEKEDMPDIEKTLHHTLPLIDVGGYYTRRLEAKGLAEAVVDYSPILKAYQAL